MHSMDQGSAAWHECRLGKATASKIADIMAKGKGNAPSATRANYLAQLVAERLTGTPTETFTSPAMMWGTEKEADARNAYQMAQLCEVKEVGFADHPTIAMSGASPDGLIGADGLLEVKCPGTATHIATLRGAPIASGYRKQMLWQMACTGRAWCDFVSFDPRLPETMQLHIRRVERDEAEIAEIEAEVSKFLAEVDETVTALRNEYEPQREAA